MDAAANRTAETGGPRSVDSVGRGPAGEAGKVRIFFRSGRHRRPPRPPPRSVGLCGEGGGRGGQCDKKQHLQIDAAALILLAFRLFRGSKKTAVILNGSPPQSINIAADEIPFTIPSPTLSFNFSNHSSIPHPNVRIHHPIKF